MNRNDMLLMLHELDKELSTSLTIEICGSYRIQRIRDLDYGNNL